MKRHLKHIKVDRYLLCSLVYILKHTGRRIKTRYGDLYYRNNTWFLSRGRIITVIDDYEVSRVLIDTFSLESKDQFLQSLKYVEPLFNHM
ncbi:MAG: hypothetical protein QXS37_05180 [Candidatus Aenigmatarchaeota archaeon]